MPVSKAQLFKNFKHDSFIQIARERGGEPETDPVLCARIILFRKIVVCAPFSCHLSSAMSEEGTLQSLVGLTTVLIGTACPLDRAGMFGLSLCVASLPVKRVRLLTSLLASDRGDNSVPWKCS